MTDARVTTEAISVAVPDGFAEAWVSRGAGQGAGLLLYSDAFGLRPQIRRMAERMAGWGYVVLAPHVFHRDGSVADLAPDVDLRSAEAKGFRDRAFGRVRALTAELAERDVPAYVDALVGLPGVTAPVGVTGYCMGARLAVRTASLRPDVVGACAGFHGGGLATDSDDSPHRGLDRARAAFCFGHADHDRSMPPEAIARLDDALDRAGLDHVSEVYGGAAHGFTMADTAAYDEEAAERHFAALEDLLRRSLGGRSPDR